MLSKVPASSGRPRSKSSMLRSPHRKVSIADCLHFGFWILDFGLGFRIYAEGCRGLSQRAAEFDSSLRARGVLPLGSVLCGWIYWGPRVGGGPLRWPRDY